jgi:soluble cytochrome b562
MNILTSRLLRILSLIAALVAPPLLGAAEHEHEEDSPLHTAMEDMGKAMRAVNKGLTSADPAAAKTDILDALQKMQALAVEGKALVPPTIEKLPAAEQPAKLAAYRAELAAAIVIMLEIERAVLGDQWDAAKEGFARLRTARKEGHEKYNPEE